MKDKETFKEKVSDYNEHMLGWIKGLPKAFIYKFVKGILITNDPDLYFSEFFIHHEIMYGSKVSNYKHPLL